MDQPDVVEHFYGVYLLYCTNPKYKGRTYIGYTVDPNRRIKQHNAGKKFGGAWRTNNKGPWEMVMIVHGFPNDISALRFEWAWQHPDVSCRLKHVPRKKSGEKSFYFQLRIVSEMLRVGPWSRLPLTIRWLVPEYAKNFPPDRSPPMHMPLVYGKVVSKKIGKAAKIRAGNIDASENLDESENIAFCSLCDEFVEREERLRCLSPSCLLVTHLICLAKRFEKDNAILPVEGTCPACKMSVLWGDLIRKMKGCYKDLAEAGEGTDNSGSESDLSGFSTD